MEEDKDKDQIINRSSSQSIDGSKFVIKLKIPKLEYDNIENSLKIMSEEAKIVCPECKKEFSSGKALGGHMRIHSQSFNKNPNFLKTKKIKKVDIVKKKPNYLSLSVNDHGGNPKCSQCGKTFPSMKSLFGHMRCHPERIWRGIFQPKISKRYVFGSQSSSISIKQEDDDKNDDGGKLVVDLVNCLSGWGATERRGRPSLKSDKDEDEDEDSVLLEAVEDLMSLAQGMNFEGCNSNSLNNKDKGKLLSDDCIESDSEINTKQQQQQQVVYKSFDNNKIKKRKKMKLMMDLEPENVVVDDEQSCKYKCTTCDKCFSSHQALGGHRSSHNKVKIPSLLIDHVYHEQQQQGDQFESSEFAGVHQCEICDKVFATGQALGGHKRCHWTGISEPHQNVHEAQVQDPSSQITFTGEDELGWRNNKVLEFDLNEIPSCMMIEEDEEVGNGNYGIGYASSSYNSNIG